MLSEEIFSCFLQPDYPEKKYLFERRLHFAKANALRCLVKLTPPIKKLETIYELLLDCAQLRRRVSDHTIFALCATELRALSHCLSRLLSKKPDQQEVVLLASAIDRFEESYHHVLRVTAREPLAFLLFLHGLKALCLEVGAGV